MASEWIYKNQDSTYGVNFSEFLSQEKERWFSFESNLVLSQLGIRVSEFELTE